MGTRRVQVVAPEKPDNGNNSKEGLGRYTIINPDEDYADVTNSVTRLRTATAGAARQTLPSPPPPPSALANRKYTSLFVDTFADLKRVCDDRFVFLKHFRERREDNTTGADFLNEILLKLQNKILRINDPDIPPKHRDGWRIAEDINHNLRFASPKVTLVKQGKKIEVELIYIFQGMK